MADFIPCLNHRAKKKGGGSAFEAKESQPLAFTFTEGDEGLQKLQERMSWLSSC